MRRWSFVAVVATLLFATLWIDFSRIHRFQNSDSLVMSLISIYRWTPLYWEQNRLGMLVPLLASPVHHPLANMLVQSGLTIFSGFSGFMLLGYYVAGRRRGLMIGVIAALLFVTLVHVGQQFDYLVYCHQFATSLTLSLLALMALSRWQRSGGWWQPPVAIVLIWTALWVNPSLAFAIGPLLLVRHSLLRDIAASFNAADDSDPLNAASSGSTGETTDRHRQVGWLCRKSVTTSA